MVQITLSRNSIQFDTKSNSYRMVLEVTATQNIVKEIFVKQRVRNPINNTFEDFFAAVASPAQLEDLNTDAPNGDTTYFRVKQVDLVGSSPDYLNQVFDDILDDIQKLVDDTNAFTTLSAATTYVLSSNN